METLQENLTRKIVSFALDSSWANLDDISLAARAGTKRRAGTNL
jgi:hypothetical protein